MNRSEIRTQIRTLADELTERPEGLFLNTELDALINVSQQNVELALIEYIPWYFRGTKTFSTSANKETYDIESEVGIADFFLFSDIFRNTTGKKPTPLRFIEPDDQWQYGSVGGKGEPDAWGFEDKDTIFFRKIPNGVYSYKGYYFKKIPALDHDTSDVSPNVATPHLPESAHPLIALDVLRQWDIRSGELETSKIEDMYQDLFFDVAYNLSAPQGKTSRRRPNIREYLGK